MAIKVLRSDNQTIVPYEDRIAFDYAFGGQIGVFKNYGNELSADISVLNTFTINSGMASVQGGQFTVELSESVALQPAFSPNIYWYIVYFQIDYKQNFGKIVVDMQTQSYPTFPQSDDLRINTAGLVYFPLYKFKQTSTGILDLEKVFTEIDFYTDKITNLENTISNLETAISDLETKLKPKLIFQGKDPGNYAMFGKLTPRTLIAEIPKSAYSQNTNGQVPDEGVYRIRLESDYRVTGSPSIPNFGDNIITNYTFVMVLEWSQRLSPDTNLVINATSPINFSQAPSPMFNYATGSFSVEISKNSGYITLKILDDVTLTSGSNFNPGAGNFIVKSIEKII